MLRISFTIFLALTAWIHPANAISAFAETPQENPIFINYEQFHESNNGSDQHETTPNSNDSKLGSGKSTNKTTNSIHGRRNIPSTPKTEDTSGRAESGRYNGKSYSKDEVIRLIENYSREYRIESAAPLCIAKLESGYNQFSKNKSSSASGVFAYLISTWAGTDEGKAGLSVFDADANVKAAVKYMAIHKNTRPWVVASKCPPIQLIK